MASTEKKPTGGGEKKHVLDDREPIAPDGGWGWVILLASFLTSVIVDGVCFAFGIFMLEFLRYFQENKGKTAWIGSVLNGTYMVMGPLVGALANRFGCRAVAIAGSLWSAMAFFLSTFSQNIDMLILTYGVLGGIGFGLMYLPSIVIVGFYFDKKRAFATGIATCGSGIGAFIMAPLCKILIDQYGWRGAQWIVTAIVLNGIVLGALYRPLTFKDMEKMRRKWRRKQMQKLKDIIENDTSDTTESDETEITGATDTTDNYRIQIDEEKNFANNNNTHQNSTLQDKRLELLKTLEDPNNVGRDGIRRRTVSNQTDDGEDVRLRNLGDSWHSLIGFAASMDNIGKPELSGEIHQQRKLSKKICDVPREILATVAKTMDFTMLRNPVFLLYGLSCILCMAGFFIPFIYLPDNAIGLGYSSGQAALLLSILGITNTFGRVITGWVSDRPWADCLLINNMALIIGGIATILCPFFTSYIALVIYSSIFGLCIGMGMTILATFVDFKKMFDTGNHCVLAKLDKHGVEGANMKWVKSYMSGHKQRITAFVSLRSIILVELIGLNKLTSAFGIIVLCQGLTSFVGAPIAGSLYDLTGTFDMSFYVAGTTIALAGIICLPLRRVAAWYNNYKGKFKLKKNKDGKKSKDTKPQKGKSPNLSENNSKEKEKNSRLSSV